MTLAGAPAQAVNVTTYHYDNSRTGWNAGETALSPRALRRGVRNQTFKLTASVALDDQVDAQPLLVTNQQIQGQGAHDVVYVTTANNTVYAIDASSGAILLQRNFGPPVPEWQLPGGCSTNAVNVGTTATPVIDAASGRLYFVSYTFDNGVYGYFLHAVDLSTLADALAPVKVAATGHLSNGDTYAFDASVSRQRAALLLANGNVYAAFASFCDLAADKSRGWLLGWQKDTLAPLAHNELTNIRKKAPNDFFLTPIWMSGYGPAAAPDTVDLYFVTGNSDPGGRSISFVKNIAESAVRMKGDLSAVESAFTPGNAATLEKTDGDFGSGGFLLLPAQPGAASHLGVAAGKDGAMYLMDADNLGDGKPGDTKPLGTYDIGPCWCGPSYYTASDGTGRVVGSGGNALTVWKVRTSAGTRLKQLLSVPEDFGAQDPGFFTTVSSNGTTAGSAVVWAVTRPDSSADPKVKLYAFDPEAKPANALLFSGDAGQWPNTDGNANIVPVVANGRVYVASYQTLSIFGLSSAPAARPAKVAKPRVPVLPRGTHEIFGTVLAVNGDELSIARRDGSVMTADAGAAKKAFRYMQPNVGSAAVLRGRTGAKGVFEAAAVLRAKKNPHLWRPDR
ncbi:MAG: hypothetical protein JOZ72_18255 [Alphaproteobacteria bacterium]|nr:hypothetical protein [Alphaproteobacteria bacterium]